MAETNETAAAHDAFAVTWTELIWEGKHDGDGNLLHAVARGRRIQVSNRPQKLKRDGPTWV